MIELKVERTFSGHGEDVNDIAYFPPPLGILVTCGDDKSVRLWDYKTGKNIHVYRNDELHKDVVYKCVKCNEMSVLTCSRDHSVQQFSVVQPYRRIQKITFPTHSGKSIVKLIKLTDDLFVCTLHDYSVDDKVVAITSLETGKLVKVFSCTRSGGESAEHLFNSKSKKNFFFYTTKENEEQAIGKFDIETMEHTQKEDYLFFQVNKPQTKYNLRVFLSMTSIVNHRGEEIIVAGGTRGMMCLLNVTMYSKIGNGHIVWIKEKDEIYFTFAFQNRYIFAAVYGGTIAVYDTENIFSEQRPDPKSVEDSSRRYKERKIFVSKKFHHRSIKKICLISKDKRTEDGGDKILEIATGSFDSDMKLISLKRFPIISEKDPLAELDMKERGEYLIGSVEEYYFLEDGGEEIKKKQFLSVKMEQMEIEFVPKVLLIFE